MSDGKTSTRGAPARPPACPGARWRRLGGSLARVRPRAPGRRESPDGGCVVCSVLGLPRHFVLLRSVSSAVDLFTLTSSPSLLCLRLRSRRDPACTSADEQSSITVPTLILGSSIWAQSHLLVFLGADVRLFFWSLFGCCSACLAAARASLFPSVVDYLLSPSSSPLFAVQAAVPARRCRTFEGPSSAAFFAEADREGPFAKQCFALSPACGAASDLPLMPGFVLWTSVS